MWEKVNFLCEVGTEEIPAGYIPVAIEQVKKKFTDVFSAQRIPCEEVSVYATPRRIIVCGRALAAAQTDEMLEFKGPSADRAYEADGKPSKALTGFMQGNGLTEKDLEKRDTPKGSYIFGSRKAESRSTAEILPSLVAETILSVPFPKTMRWNTKTVGFPRPIRYLCVLFNDKVVPVEIDGIKAGNLTRGHYVRTKEMLTVSSIASYPKLLNDNNVFFDQNERKEIIRKLLSDSADKIGGVLVQDEDLLNVVTYIVEFPHVVTCSFKESYLEIPDIVLITEMKEHQKYFAVRDKKGNLSNSFLVISNNPPTDFIRKGNERVITARFNDAGFFFKEDRKHKLADKVESLKSVVFHKELGTIYDKVERVKKAAAVVGKEFGVNDAEAAKIDRAVTLSKADLNTAMVFEFTSLQGKIGRIYALLDGEDKDVAEAIDDHYRPRFQGDSLPSSVVSITLSLSEKIDNLYGSFSVGNIPKGSADPYALRRQSHAIVELLVRNKLHCRLDKVCDAVAANYKNGPSFTVQILEFIQTRAKTLLADEGIRYDEVDAVLSTGSFDFYELYLLSKSLHEFRSDAAFSSMLLSFKRMNNILSQFTQKNKGYTLSFNASLLAENEEKKLSEYFSSKKGEIEKHIAANAYKELFGILIGAKPVIDLFFDKIMVMAEDVKLRDNRLALLESVIKPFSALLDFSKISE
jgi:glycyl-tRNA synthetase beta chain